MVGAEVEAAERQTLEASKAGLGDQDGSCCLLCRARGGGITASCAATDAPNRLICISSSSAHLATYASVAHLRCA